MLVALITTNYLATIIPLKIKESIDFIQNKPLFGSLSEIIISLIIFALILAGARALSPILIFIPGRRVEFDLRNIRSMLPFINAFSLTFTKSKS